jgi:anti-sigma-K factor RskA
MAMSPSDHDALREQAELYVLGALPPAERTTFETHLATCVDCRARVQSLSPVLAALAHVPPQHDPPPALRDRVLRTVTGSNSGVVAPTSHRERTNARLPWLAAAASLLLAAGLGLYAVSLRARIGALEQLLQQASGRAAVAEQQIADLRRTTDDARTQLAVLEAPDLQRINLAGQAAAPKASARAFWSRSRGLVFTASDLPAAPAGKTYQLWVLTKAPAPISAGLFKPDPQGRVAAVFDTPLDLPQPIGMAVTIEPDGGVPAPTGDKYLAGL